MKKILTLFIILLLCTTFLCGCNTTYKPQLPTKQEVADISVEKIEGLPSDFVKGVDVSSIVSLQNAGVEFFNKQGQKQDIFKTLADAGVNYLRVRVWNNPFDSNNNGYGGGNCNVDTAKQISRKAKEYNLNLCVDFHYSDFWADPQSQTAPKAWETLTLEEKCQEIYTFTLNSLKQITLKAAHIGMVQIGNEIDNGMCGETDEHKVLQLLKSASKAVRDFSQQLNQDTKIIVHFAGGSVDIVKYKAHFLHTNQLDYDIFGVSYYAYWHGTMQTLTQKLRHVNSVYQKDVIVMETSYPYTLENGDTHHNNVGKAELIDGYPATVQGQANNLRDVMQATHTANGLGVFYWEPAWIPASNDDATNKTLWEQYGCGWASSFAGEYSSDARDWHGGSSWDNQALFDFEGKPLPSLDVFKYVNYGAVLKDN